MKNENEIPIDVNSSDFNLQMDNFSETNNLNESWHTALDEENNLIKLFYANPTIFREFILPNLDSENICDLYKISHLKNPSITPKNFLPPERFSRSHTVLSIEFEQPKILYNFEFDAQQTKFSKFKPILYNPTDKSLQILKPDCFQNLEKLTDGHLVANIGELFIPFRTELNTQLLHYNLTAMIATDEDTEQFLLVLEDNTNKNSKQYLVICYGKYNVEESNEKSVLLYESRVVSRHHENVEFPQDIDFILKAKYISGIQKYVFKFQFGHIKICQKFFTKLSYVVEKLNDLSNWMLEFNNYKKKAVLIIFFIPFVIVKALQFFVEFSYVAELENSGKFLQGLQLFSQGLISIIWAYLWITPYKVIVGTVLSPLYFYLSPKIFFLAFNLEPVMSALFWGPTIVYSDLQFAQKNFQIYPLQQMFAIPTMKTPMRNIFREFLYAWLIMTVLTSFVYAFLPEQTMSGEFLE